MNIGERKFIKRIQVILVECVENDSNNVNDARDRLVKETVIASRKVTIAPGMVAVEVEKVVGE